MPTEYNAQVLKLDLPEQETLKNDAERCSADPGTLQSIGSAVGHQVRITRTDANNPGLFALYTVAEANPPADLSDPSRANVVRTGLTGRKRLGTPAEMDAVVQAAVVDAAPPSSGARFFEVAPEDDRTQGYFIAIAPHGGDIEKFTDDEARHLGRELTSNGYPATTWICRGFGDELMGASARFHITADDLNPANFPLLGRIATRKFCHGVAFHGFSKRPEDADLYIGGGASDTLKRAIREELVAANLPLQIRIATDDDDPKFQGRKAENLINRLAAQGIQIEQSGEAREFSEKIAKAIATVYRSPIRRFLCALTNLLR